MSGDEQGGPSVHSYTTKTTLTIETVEYAGDDEEAKEQQLQKIEDRVGPWDYEVVDSESERREIDSSSRRPDLSPPTEDKESGE